MLTPAKYAIPLLISLLLLGSATTSQANSIHLNTIAIADAASLRDAQLEQQLDDYLTLQLIDPVAANEQLGQLIAQFTEQTPLESKVRALTYQLFYYLYKPDDSNADKVILKLSQLKESPLSANALAEIMAAELETQFYRNQFNQAYIGAEQLARVLPDVDNSRVSYWVNSLLGRLFRADSQFDKALQHYELALDFLSQTNDSRTLIRRAYLNQQSALVHAELKNWQRARELLEELYAEVKHHRQDEFLPDLYLSLGFVMAGQQDFSAAEAINIQGIEKARAQKQQNLVLTFMNNLGSIYIEQHNYPAATAILQEALAEAIAINDQDNVQIVRFNLGYLQVLSGQAEQGLTQMHDAFGYYQQKNNKAEIEGFLSWFAKAYKALGDYQKLAETLEWQMQLSEEIMSDEREKSTRDLLARYDLKSQSQQITILQQQNELQEELLRNKQLQQTITLLFVLIMCFVATLLINLYRKVRKTNRRLKEVNKQLEYQSLRDPLTGLLNRRAMQEQMARRHKSSEATPCGLLLLDIDFFKQINDNYGHAAGDAVLVEISRRLMTLVSDTELLIRWGGEEFLLVVQRPAITDIDKLCRQLLKEVSQLAVHYEGRDIAVTISGGYINLPFAAVAEHQFNWEKVLQVTDMALYLSKVNGRNQINLIDGLNVPFSHAEPHLQSDLNGAIRENMVNYHTITG